MWWLNPELHSEDAQIEINLPELQKFIMQEVLFIQDVDQLLEKGLDWKSFFTGRTPWLLYEAWSKLAAHFWELVQYFSPKEVLN